MMFLHIDFEEFLDWLASHQDNETVGQPGRYFFSPLAHYLSAQAGGRVVGVDGKWYGCALVDICRWVELPRWAQVFSNLCEKRFGSELSAYEALGLLVEVETVLAVECVMCFRKESRRLNTQF